MAGSHYALRPASRLTLDWMLAAVALIAIAVVAGSLIRIGGETREGAGQDAVGMRLLRDTDRLIAFEDYSFDAGGWDGREVDDSDTALGSVLGPVTDQVLSRLFGIADGTRRVTLAFDVIGMAGPVDVQISINGTHADDVQSRETTASRVRYLVNVDNPGPFVALAIGAPDGVTWALDNLSVTAELPQSD